MSKAITAAATSHISFFSPGTSEVHYIVLYHWYCVLPKHLSLASFLVLGYWLSYLSDWEWQSFCFISVYKLCMKKMHEESGVGYRRKQKVNLWKFVNLNVRQWNKTELENEFSVSVRSLRNEMSVKAWTTTHKVRQFLSTQIKWLCIAFRKNKLVTATSILRNLLCYLMVVNRYLLRWFGLWFWVGISFFHDVYLRIFVQLRLLMKVWFQAGYLSPTSYCYPHRICYRGRCLNYLA